MTMRSASYRLRRRTIVVIAALALSCLAGWMALKASPWPSALLVRWAFDRGGVAANAALQKYVPAGMSTLSGLRYDDRDPDARLDVHLPPDADRTDRRFTTIVWIHGGGFVSGSRTQIANYAKLLAADGYAVAAVDYSIAPGARYPVPVRQLNRALAWLSVNADELRLDRNRFVLAGDSAGAQLAAQLAALASSPMYAQSMGLKPGIGRSQLIGTILYCGPHDAALMARDGSWLLRTMVWSYFGAFPPPASAIDEFSVVRHVTPSFPPTFISAGNADPLVSQSYAMADVLQRQGVEVDRLFYAADHTPPLQHEYQFDLDSEEGREALRRTKAFLKRL